MVPQSIYRNLSNGTERQLTRNEDFTPDELKNVQRVVFEAKRADGLDVRVRVTLPPTFREGDKLPAIFWFYPREYTSFEAYYRTSRGANGQPTGGNEPGPGRYPTFAPGSVQLFTLLGYAVVEPDSPIIGPEGRMNDNYVHDLRNNLTAIIDELDRRGIVDRTRLAIGGHSYGGFSTMNAMVHTPYFKAGISGAGNSNRLLTPLGFQTERRDLWSARDTYLDMSSLLNANNLTGALLLYHGMEDQNVGTNPINSERMFHALNGLGKTAALYMYPFEEHGQVGEETRLDMWARWAAWLDKYVKGTPTRPAATTQEQQSGSGSR
jgi:dipeptidyl aminopeptidase/acylaminoacyl peptidase